LDYFVLLSTILVFLAMIEVVVTSSLHAKSVSKKAQRITRYARIAFPTVFVLSNGVLYFS
jgi:cadmium resistance protein CadD (predicted permease)